MVCFSRHELYFGRKNCAFCFEYFIVLYFYIKMQDCLITVSNVFLKVISLFSNCGHFDIRCRMQIPPWTRKLIWLLLFTVKWLPTCMIDSFLWKKLTVRVAEINTIFSIFIDVILKRKRYKSFLRYFNFYGCC